MTCAVHFGQTGSAGYLAVVDVTRICWTSTGVAVMVLDSLYSKDMLVTRARV